MSDNAEKRLDFSFFIFVDQSSHMRSFLFQPYPFGSSIAHKLRICAGIGLFITLFLALFQPFGLHELAPQQLWLHALWFGLVSFLISGLLQAGLPRLLPGVFAEEHWKSWKEILHLLLILLCVSGGNFLLMQQLYPTNASFRSFGHVLWITVQVGIFPVVFVVFMKQLLLYRRYAAEALQVNRQLKEPMVLHDEVVPAAVPPAKVLLVGEGHKERLELALQALLFISSSDNYIRVVYSSKGLVQNQLLRCSLKGAEQQLSAYPSLFRCHRMYLVHLEKVVRVSGNAQGLRLHLEGVAEPIPVSRSLTQTIKERLAHLSHSPQAA